MGTAGKAAGKLKEFAKDPVAALVIDTYLKSNQAPDPNTQDHLRIMAKDIANECIVQNRHEALERS